MCREDVEQIQLPLWVCSGKSGLKVVLLLVNLLSPLNETGKAAKWNSAGLGGGVGFEIYFMPSFNKLLMFRIPP